MGQSNHNYDAKEYCKGFDTEQDLISYAALGATVPEAGSLGDFVSPSPAISENAGDIPVGNSKVYPLQFVSKDGQFIDVEMTVTNLTGNSHTFAVTSNNGTFSNNGAGRWRVDLVSKTLDKIGKVVPFSIAIRAQSIQGDQERYWADGTSTANRNLTPVDVFLNAAGNPATMPATGIVTTGINDQSPRTMAYEDKTEVSFEWQGQANVGSTIRMYLYEGPEVLEHTNCEQSKCVAKELKNIRDSIKEHPEAGYAQCGSTPNLNNGSGAVGATGNANENLFSFTPHATGTYRFDYSSESIVGGATPSTGMNVGTAVDTSDVYSTAPPTGDADGARLSPTRLKNFVELELTEGVTYFVEMWAGGGSYGQGNKVCVAEAGLASYVAGQTDSDTNSDVVTHSGADFTTTNGIVVTDGDQYILLDNGETWGDEGLTSENDADYVVDKRECYSLPVQIGNNGNTRNVGPAFAGLTVSDVIGATPFSGSVQANKITSVQATIDNTGSGSLVVTNQTTGQSTTTDTQSWTGTFSSLTGVVFTLDKPLDISVGDLVVITTVGSGGRWRYNFNGAAGHMFQGSTGTGSIANSMAGHMDGTYDIDAVTLTDIENIEPDILLVNGAVGTIPAGAVPCEDLLTQQQIDQVLDQVDDKNTPSKVCKDSEVDTATFTQNAETGKDIGTYFAGNIPTTDDYHISLDPDAVGTADFSIGGTLGMASVSVHVVAKVPGVNRVNRMSWSASMDATGQITIAVSNRGTTAIAAGQTASDFTANDVGATGFGGQGATALQDAGIVNISVEKQTAVLQLDGTYLTNTGQTLTVDEVISGGWGICTDVEEPQKIDGKDVFCEIVSDTAEPINALTGTLSDGTTYEVANDQANGNMQIAANGDIRIENDSDVTIEFSAPVAVEIRPTVDAPPINNPIVWQTQANGNARVTSDGDSTVYTPGTFDAQLTDITGGLEGALTTANAPDADDDWGVVVISNVTTVTLAGRDADAYNFTAKTISEESVCESISELKARKLISGLTQTREVANADLSAQDMNAPAIASLDNADHVAEGGWSIGTNLFQYTGEPTYVVINAQAHQEIANNANIQRAAPTLELQKLIGGAWTTIAKSATGYTRDASDHEQSSNTIFFRDKNPGTDPQYRLVKARDTTLTGAMQLSDGQFDLEAVTIT